MGQAGSRGICEEAGRLPAGLPSQAWESVLEGLEGREGDEAAAGLER